MRPFVCTRGFAIATLLCSLSTARGNWPEFRGPQGEGHAAEAQIPTAIDASVVQWEIDLPGKAWSSPVVWENQVWLTNANVDGSELSVVCVDRRSGEIIHNKVLFRDADPPFCYPANSYASSTPVIEAGRLYVHFGATLTACVDTATCEVLWQRTDLECDHHRGAAASPVLHQDRLLIALDGFDVQYVVALEKTTGKTLWKQDRQIDYETDNGDQMKAYSTGTVLRAGQQEMFISPSAMATIAYDPTDGRMLWKVYHKGMNASGRMPFDGQRVFITNGSGSIVAVRIDGSGDVTASHVDWSNGKSVAKKASPLLVDDLLYMTTDDGLLSCRDSESGEIIWIKRIAREFAASPLLAGGKIYCFSTEGKIITVQPGREAEVLAETTLGDGFMATPAIIDNQIILRSKSKLYICGSP